jgi:hypothetical protein
LTGNLGQAFGQGEEGKLGGTDGFRHAVLDVNPARFTHILYRVLQIRGLPKTGCFEGLV